MTTHADEDAPLVAIYADESCLGNGRDGENPGGAGVLLEYRRPGGELVRRDICVSDRATTNNRMALRSVIEAFTALSRKGRRFRAVFTTDSRYLVDGMSRWIHDWARRGWKRKAGVIENLDLWQQAVASVGEHEVEWRWVRGHDGHAQNEYVNHLATAAAASLTESGGPVESGFDAWVAAEQERGVRLRLAPFPSEGAFRSAARLPALSAGRP